MPPASPTLAGVEVSRQSQLEITGTMMLPTVDFHSHRFRYSALLGSCDLTTNKAALLSFLMPSRTSWSNPLVQTSSHGVLSP